jgi:hypothetical protein
MDVGRPTTSSSSSTPTTAPNEAATQGAATDLEVQSRLTKLLRRCGGPSWRPARRSAGASRCRPSGWARWCRRPGYCGAKRAGEVVHLRVCLRGLPIVLEREPVRQPSGERPLQARVRIVWGSARPGRRSGHASRSAGRSVTGSPLGHSTAAHYGNRRGRLEAQVVMLVSAVLSRRSIAAIWPRQLNNYGSIWGRHLGGPTCQVALAARRGCVSPDWGTRWRAGP